MKFIATLCISILLISSNVLANDSFENSFISFSIGGIKIHNIEIGNQSWWATWELDANANFMLKDYGLENTPENDSVVDIYDILLVGREEIQPDSDDLDFLHDLIPSGARIFKHRLPNGTTTYVCLTATTWSTLGATGNGSQIIFDGRISSRYIHDGYTSTCQFTRIGDTNYEGFVTMAFHRLGTTTIDTGSGPETFDNVWLEEAYITGPDFWIKYLLWNVKGQGTVKEIAESGSF